MIDNIIPLGDNCAISIILRELGLRKKSYPFDWCSHIGPLPTYSIIEINILFLIQLLLSENPSMIVDSFLNHKEIIFPHEFGSQKEIYQKYLRRMERLYKDVIEKKENVFIILTRGFIINEEIIRDLHTLIMDYNPNNKILVISGVSNTSLENLNLSNYYYKYIYYDISSTWDYEFKFRSEVRNFMQNFFQDL